MEANAPSSAPRSTLTPDHQLCENKEFRNVRIEFNPLHLLELLRRDGGVEQTDLRILLVLVDARVGEAVVFVSLEFVHSVVHARRVEHIQAQ